MKSSNRIPIAIFIGALLLVGLPLAFQNCAGQGANNASDSLATSTPNPMTIATPGMTGETTTSNTGIPSNTTTVTSTNPSADTVKVPVYQFYNGTRHFFSLIESEGPPAGYALEKIAFYVDSNMSAGATQTLYRCYSATYDTHFFSLDGSCGGQTNEGLYGYTYTTPVNTSVTPIYIFYLAASLDYFATVNSTEVSSANGWTQWGVGGYVYTQ